MTFDYRLPITDHLRIIFAGTPEFARIALDALIQAGYSIPLVLTQPDRPAGRGMKLVASSVKQYALQHQIDVFQPDSLKNDEAIAKLQAVQADVMIVAAYGLILPKAVLAIPKKGCLNIHASLLPRWRGAAPIQRAILAGDTVTGITIMQMEQGLDTGPILLQQELAIDPMDTAGSLHDKLAHCGAQLIVQSLTALAQGKLPAKPQPSIGITYAEKISKAEATLNWKESAELLERKIRAFNPFPVATTFLRGMMLKIWGAEVFLSGAESSDKKIWDEGKVLEVTENGIVIICGEGRLRILEMQKAGGKRLPMGEFLRGFSIKVGDSFISDIGLSHPGHIGCT